MAIGQYDDQKPVTLPLNLDGLALILLRADHGIHRFLSAAVRANRQFKINTEEAGLIREIEQLLGDDDVCVRREDDIMLKAA